MAPRATLFSMSLSHPSHAARRALELKGIEHRVVNLVPGLHGAALRGLGFRHGTVPALRIDGRRVQGSLDIPRHLEGVRPDPPLLPADPERRRAVEEAERWGHDELQPVPRRLFRWGAANRPEVRRWMAGELLGLPAPGVLAKVNLPVARFYARVSGVDDEGLVRETVAAVPGLLDRVDALIAEGTIGTGELNAADLQIGAGVRVLMSLEDLRGLVLDRPCAALAMRVLPKYPGPVPSLVPAAWLP